MATSRQPHCARNEAQPRPSQPLRVTQIEAALLTLKTVAELTGLSTATLYRKAKTDPDFPKLLKLGTRCTRLRAGDLLMWLDRQASQ